MENFINHNYWEVFDGTIDPPSQQEFMAGYQNWRSITSGFINGAGRSHIHNEPSEDQASEQKKNADMSDYDPGLGWPNMDNWKKVWRMLAVADQVGATDEARIQILNCALGVGTATEFWTYQKNLNLPNIREILEDPSKFKGGLAQDQAFIVANQLTDRVRNGGDGKTLAAAFEILDKIEKEHFDIAIPKQQMLCGWYVSDIAEGGQRYGDAPSDLMKTMMERADEYMVPMAESGLGFMNKGRSKNEDGDMHQLLNYDFDKDESLS
jgi:hypothetical protein